MMQSSVSPSLLLHHRRSHWHCQRRTSCSHLRPVQVDSSATSLSSSAQPSTSSNRNPIEVHVENTSWNSRKLFCRVTIEAPMDLVWEVLTDYDNLSKFIPSLVENKCMERRPNGALLYQVGAQDVAMGVKFCAKCILDCTEWREGGVPEEFCSSSGDGSDGLLPAPGICLAGVPTRDIAFVMREGDFNAFRGIWRMQPGLEEQTTTLLSYSLYVQPQSWLPVGVIQNKIRGEVSKNLQSVRAESERRNVKSQE